MRLAVFGGTGTVGTPMVAQALWAGHEVRALARSPEKLQPAASPRLTVIPGDALDPDAVSATLAGSDAALSALGGAGGVESLRTGIPSIIAAMQKAGPRRLVVVQGMHLRFAGDPPGVGRRVVVPVLRLISPGLVPATAVMAAAVRASGLDWTVVRIPPVVPGVATAGYRSGILRLGPWSRVTAGDAAAFALECLTDETTVRAAPMVDTPRAERRRPVDARRPGRSRVRM